MNIKNVLRLIFTIAIYSFFRIYSMDQPQILDDQMIVWQIILQHGVELFDYRMISSLVISKDYDQLLRSTASCREEYLRRQLNLGKNLTWHKYGAMCGKAMHDICIICFPSQDLSGRTRYQDGLFRKRFYLHKNGDQRQPCSITDPGFYCCLPHQPQPFFNTRNEFCFYGYERKNKNFESEGKIIKYIWESNKNPSQSITNQERCMTNIKNEEGNLIDLAVFLEFPVLLRSFLKSRVVYKKNKEWGITKKIYGIKGVKIPENYEDHKQYFSTIKYGSFQDLPKEIRKAVVARRAECQLELSFN